LTGKQPKVLIIIGMSSLSSRESMQCEGNEK
jgi:hypothetical protein